MQLRQLIYGKPLDTDTWLIAYDSEGPGAWNKEPERLRAVLAHLLSADWEVRGHSSLFRVLVKSTRDYWTYYKVFPNGTDRDSANRCIFRFHAVRLSPEELAQLKWNPWGLDDFMVARYGGYELLGSLFPGGKLDIRGRSAPQNMFPLVIASHDIVGRDQLAIDERALAELIGRWRVGPVRIITLRDDDGEKCSYASRVLRETAADSSVGAFISLDVPSVLEATPSQPSCFALGVKAREDKPSRIDGWAFVDLRNGCTAMKDTKAPEIGSDNRIDKADALEAPELLRAKLESIESKVDRILAENRSRVLGPSSRPSGDGAELSESLGQVKRALHEIDGKLGQALEQVRVVSHDSPANADKTHDAEIKGIRSILDALTLRIEKLLSNNHVRSTPAPSSFVVWGLVSSMLLSIACLYMTFVVFHDLQRLEAGELPSSVERRLSDITRKAIADQLHSESKVSSIQRENATTGGEQSGKEAANPNPAPTETPKGVQRKKVDKGKSTSKNGQTND